MDQGVVTAEPSCKRSCSCLSSCSNRWNLFSLLWGTITLSFIGSFHSIFQSAWVVVVVHHPHFDHFIHHNSHVSLQQQQQQKQEKLKQQDVSVPTYLKESIEKSPSVLDHGRNDSRSSDGGTLSDYHVYQLEQERDDNNTRNVANDDVDADAASNEFIESPLVPNWMKKYFQWHSQQRQEMKMIEDGKSNRIQSYTNSESSINSKKFLIVTCLNQKRSCGGASDRLHPLLWYVLLAYQSNRILLIYWERPAPLEAFLVPTGPLDWRLPHDLLHEVSKQPQTPIRRASDILDRRYAQKTILLVSIQIADHGYDYFNQFHDNLILLANSSASSSSSSTTAQINTGASTAQINTGASISVPDFVADLTVFDRYRYSYSGQLNYFKAMYRIVWNAVFQPSDGVKAELTKARNKLISSLIAPGTKTPTQQLQSQEQLRYAAVHIRSVYVRNHSESGHLAARAVDCIARLTIEQQQHGTAENSFHLPILVASDVPKVAQDAIRYGRSRIWNRTMLSSPLLLSIGDDQSNNKDDDSYNNTLSHRNSKDMTEILHLDRGSAYLETDPDSWNWHKFKIPEAYYNVFVDLYLLAGADCIAYGIGGYGRWALSLSRNISCGISYNEYTCNMTGIYSKIEEKKHRQQMQRQRQNLK